MPDLSSLQNTPSYATNLSFAVGEVFPHLVLPSIYDGQPMSLADFRGQKVALHLFASW